MPVKHVALTAKQQRFIAGEIKAGRFPSEKAVVQAGLDLLEKQKLAALQRQALMKEIQLGIDELDAGLGVTLTSEEEISAQINAIGRRAGLGPMKKHKRA